MNRKELKSAIEKIVKLIIKDPDSEYSENESLANDYLSYIDSIRFIELITEVESYFSIEISNKDLSIQNIKDLDSFVTMISKYINTNECEC